MSGTPEPTSNNSFGSTSTDSEEPVTEKTRIWYKIRYFFKAIKPILTSHHPLCDHYKEHTLHLIGRDWCIGCFIGYPAGILMLLIGYLTGLFQMLESITLWIIGASLMGSYILSIVGLTKIRWIRIISKIPLGIGAAFLIAALFSYPIPIWLSFFLSFLLIQAFVSIINIKRAFEMRKTCNNCVYNSDRNNCPGLQPVMEKINKIKKK